MCTTSRGGEISKCQNLVQVLWESITPGLPADEVTPKGRLLCSPVTAAAVSWLQNRQGRWRHGHGVGLGAGCCEKMFAQLRSWKTHRSNTADTPPLSHFGEAMLSSGVYL